MDWAKLKIERLTRDEVTEGLRNLPEQRRREVMVTDAEGLMILVNDLRLVPGKGREDIDLEVVIPHTNFTLTTKSLNSERSCMADHSPDSSGMGKIRLVIAHTGFVHASEIWDNDGKLMYAVRHVKLVGDIDKHGWELTLRLCEDSYEIIETEGQDKNDEHTTAT